MYSDGVCEDIGAGQIHFIKKGCAHKIEVYHDEDFRYICIGYNRNNNEENMRDFGELVKYKNAVTKLLSFDRFFYFTDASLTGGFFRRE